LIQGDPTVRRTVAQHVLPWIEGTMPRQLLSTDVFCAIQGTIGT
jgi:hypothetical protein